MTSLQLALFSFGLVEKLLFGTAAGTGKDGTKINQALSSNIPQTYTNCIIYIYTNYIYIYGTPPWDLPQSILIYCLYMYIYKIYIYVHICIRVSYFFKDVLWVVAVHTIKTSWKQKKTIFDDSFGENPWGKPKKNKKPRENQQKTIFGDSLGKLYWQNQKNFEKTNKNKKPKLFRECLVWGSCLVFFGFA